MKTDPIFSQGTLTGVLERKGRDIVSVAKQKAHEFGEIINEYDEIYKVRKTNSQQHVGLGCSESSKHLRKHRYSVAAGFD
jgi:hypothetical protein